MYIARFQWRIQDFWEGAGAESIARETREPHPPPINTGSWLTKEAVIGLAAMRKRAQTSQASEFIVSSSY